LRLGVILQAEHRLPHDGRKRRSLGQRDSEGRTQYADASGDQHRLLPLAWLPETGHLFALSPSGQPIAELTP
jgi:hypothetical protein